MRSVLLLSGFIFIAITNLSFSKYNDNPITQNLVDFTIRENCIGNAVEWTTVAEVNNDYFVIQRTVDGINYEDIVVINGAGNSSEPHDYSYEDRNYTDVINYYRVKMVDFDGVESCTELISIDNRKPADKDISTKLSLEGRIVNDQYRGLVIIRYVDGSFKKIMQ